MTLIATLDNIKKANTCFPAVAELIDYFQKNGITSISFDEVILHWKAIGRRDWAVWAYQNKKVFEDICNYSSDQNEIDEDALILNQLETLVFTGKYSVDQKEFDDLDSAKIGKQELDIELLKQAKNTTVCNLVIVTDDASETWVVIDLDTYVDDLNTNHYYKIFNHETGLNEQALTIKDAKTLWNGLTQKEFNRINDQAKQIAKVMIHAEFPDVKILDYDV